MGIAGTTSHADTRLLSDPSIHGDTIAFVYAGDIYVSNIDGSAPRRLTSHEATEHSPMFSPDGSRIAFSADYHGNDDVYSISVDGGQPVRHTFHPSDDVVVDWSANGDAIAFASSRQRLNGRSAQLFHIALEGGLPELQMQARFFRGRYDDEGENLAFMAFGPAYNALYGGSSGWKGYRGGTSPSIDIMALDGQTVTRVPGERVNDIEPVWVGDQVYFLSDRDGEIFKLHRFDPASGEITRITDNTTWDARALDAEGNNLIVEIGGQLTVINALSGESSALAIDLTPDLPQLQPRWAKVAGQMTSAEISRSGKRVAVTARGEVFSVPTDEGSVRNISQSSGIREYDATWSPDGQQMAYIVEADRAQHLVIASQQGQESSRFPLGDNFYSLLEWGGDGDHIIYRDNHLQLFALDVASGKTQKISTDVRRQWGYGATDVATSPDGEWLAYTREEANFNRNLYLYNFDSREQVLLTNGMADAGSPAFSPEGDLLYFTASTNAGPTHIGLDMSTQERPYRAGIYVALLTEDAESPLAPKSGDEVPDNTDEKDEEDSESEALRYDMAGAAERIQALPVPQAYYIGLAVAKSGDLYYVRNVQPGVAVNPPGDRLSADSVLMRWNLEDREAQSVADDVVGLRIASGGEHALVRRSNSSYATGKLGDELKLEALGTGDLQLWIEPQAEWQQIFDDVWRMQAEYFYDPDLHGIDWQAVYDQYQPMLAHVGRREDLNRLLAEMIAELQVGHNRVGGGDVYRAGAPDVGLLGADLSMADGRVRIDRIYSGERWNPYIEGPLSAPGLNVAEGDFILAINGKPLAASDNIFAHLVGTTGEQVTLTVADTAKGKNSRDIVVEPTGSERMMRLWAWVEDNRKYVAEQTEGRVGYVYLPNTAGAGYTLFNRMFFSQTDKDAIIIDERSNGGGQAANYITDVLSRTYLAGWKDRDGLTFTTPGGAMYGPKVMLIDQDAGSGGDFLPYSFRQMEIGTLIGTRTWGGLIGISANPSLVDGGGLVVPYFRFFDADYEWSVENEGVAPDIEVMLDPIATNQGKDSQLDAAIAETLRQLETEPSPVPTEAPPYPTELGE
jgi:tricorn protease